MHRDISIGNVLMTTKPVKQREFEVPEELYEQLSSMADQELVGEIRTLCERVKELVVKLRISDECTGFVTDGDLAIPWKDCFTEENKKAKRVSRSQSPSPRSSLIEDRRAPLTSCRGIFQSRQT